MPPEPSLPGPHSAFRRFARPRGFAPARPRAPVAGGEGRARAAAAATTRLLAVYRAVDPRFVYESRVPRRCLTTPSEGVCNGGADNERHDLVLYVNDILEDGGGGGGSGGGGESTGEGGGGGGVAEMGEGLGTGAGAGTATGAGGGYQVLDSLGTGTFGQVVKCLHVPTGEVVAVKVVKNQAAYFNQAWLEISILRGLHMQMTQEEKRCVVEYKSHFVFKGHLCLVFEKLSINLFELLRQNAYTGVSMDTLRSFLSQLLRALAVLVKAEVVHCDLKPENILLTGLHTAELKLIDFGSACQLQHPVYSYVQSRFYRSPEILLGAQHYDGKIDMWSLGCVAGELFLGLPMFPGQSAMNMLARIDEMLGPFPPAFLRRCHHTQKYFNFGGDPGSGAAADHFQSFHLKSSAEYEAENNVTLPEWRRYFSQRRLNELIMAAAPRTPTASAAVSAAAAAAAAAAAEPGASGPAAAASAAAAAAENALADERALRASFVDLLLGMLRIDPEERWTPAEAAAHPFMQGLPLPGGVPWQPPGRARPEDPLARARARPVQVETHAPPGMPDMMYSASAPTFVAGGPFAQNPPAVQSSHLPAQGVPVAVPSGFAAAAPASSMGAGNYGSGSLAFRSYTGAAATSALSAASAAFAGTGMGMAPTVDRAVTQNEVVNGARVGEGAGAGFGRSTFRRGSGSYQPASAFPAFNQTTSGGFGAANLGSASFGAAGATSFSPASAAMDVVPRAASPAPMPFASEGATHYGSGVNGNSAMRPGQFAPYGRNMHTHGHDQNPQNHHNHQQLHHQPQFRQLAEQPQRESQHMQHIPLHPHLHQTHASTAAQSVPNIGSTRLRESPEMQRQSPLPGSGSRMDTDMYGASSEGEEGALPTPGSAQYRATPSPIGTPSFPRLASSDPRPGLQRPPLHNSPRLRATPSHHPPRSPASGGRQ